MPPPFTWRPPESCYSSRLPSSSSSSSVLPRINPGALCRKSHCNPKGPPIRFPFRIIGLQDERCGYLGFEISCDNQGRAILHVPHSSDLVVKSIDYTEQLVSLGDPEGCLMKRLLATRSFSSHLASGSSPFLAEAHGNFTLANCTWDFPTDLPGTGIARGTCLDGADHKVVVAPTEDYLARMFLSNFGDCDTRTMLVPVRLTLTENVTEGVWLKWDWPDCRGCEATGGRCGLKSDNGSSEVQCAHKRELSKAINLVIMAIALSPLFLCVFGSARYLSTQAAGPRHQSHDGNNNTYPPHSDDAGGTQHAVDGARGIDLASLESYPKAQIDDLGQAPRPNDDVCVICLSEYQLQETLRTIPECAHYFHAHCIDQWLKRNASCPLCRNHKES